VNRNMHTLCDNNTWWGLKICNMNVGNSSDIHNVNGIWVVLLEGGGE